MSTDTSRDVSLIQDEDVLRKMWQETEDFGRKKEIRSHMYKLREARLRDFYNTGEATTQTKTSTTIRETATKGSDISTHADSLADHSFLSLKSKEIRDSESPTRDVSYKITGPPKMIDQGWNVVTSDEKSADGKTHSTSRIATTSGTQPIDGGISNYAAKSEQKASVFRDGDDKNYTKSVGATSQSVINQEASGGDENSKFHTSYTSKSSSSKHSSEQRYTSGDDAKFITDYDAIPSKMQSSVVHKTYTTDAPDEFKTHPGYVEGKTKVITETKTLPDGSTVTTTRYETKGGKSTTSSSSTSYSTSSKQVSSSEQKASSVSNLTKSHQTIQDSKNLYNDDGKVRVIKYINQPDVETEIITTRNGNDVGQNFTSTSSTVRSVTNQFANDSKSVNVNIATENFADNKEFTRINDVKLLGRDLIDVKSTTTREDVNRKIDDVHRTTNRDEITTTRHETPIKQHETTVTKTTVVKTAYDDRKGISDDFINVERQHVADTKFSGTPKEIEPKRTETINVEVEYVAKEPVREPPKPTFDNVRPNETGPTSPAKYETEERRQPITPAQPKFDDVRPNETGPTTPAKYETQERRQPIRPAQPKFDDAGPNETPESPAKYEPQERRQPIKPPKSEFDEKHSPPDGQYDTTYRTDYVNRRVSVEVSPTHDAFARSLRAVSPDRCSRAGSTRSLRTNSTNSLRNSASPEKHPKASPDRYRPTSPIKKSPINRSSPDKSTETISKTSTTDKKQINKRKDEGTTTVVNVVSVVTDRKAKNETYNTDTITRKKKVTDDKITKTKTALPRSRSTSPTSIASDIEFIRHTTEQITDLDIDEITKHDDTKITKQTEERPSSLKITTTTKKSKKITERSPTSPLTDLKDAPKKNLKSPTKDDSEKPPRYFAVSPKDDAPKDKVFKRTDTYEERCRQILGIDKKTVDKSTIDVVDKTSRTKSPEKKSPSATSPVKESPKKPSTPTKVQEFPSQGKKSPEKSKTQDRKSPEKENKPTVQDSSSPKSRGPHPEKSAPTKNVLQEFPSQVKKSPGHEPLGPYPEKSKPVKDAPSVQEFPSQIRKSPQREPLEPYPEKNKPSTCGPSVQEFPSQVRKSPTREPLEPYPEKTKPVKDVPSVQEFPAHVRKAPQREPLEPYPEKTKPVKDAPSVQEFPAHDRETPQREPLEPYPEKTKPVKDAPSVQEFPAHVRKTPQREPLEPYPEKSKPVKDAPSIQEFPAHIRKTPQREPLEPYPEKSKPVKDAPSIQEFPAHIRKSPQREPLEPYPEKCKPTRDVPSINEFPSQIKPTPGREPLGPYPEKSKPTKHTPSVQEFPSQIRQSPQGEPLEPYPGKTKQINDAPKIAEFPSQVRKSPEKEYRQSPDRISLSDLPDTRRSPDRVSLDDIPRPKTEQSQPSTKSPTRKSPGRISLHDLPDKPAQTNLFIANEKIDSDITITKYKDGSIKTPRGIPVKSPSKKTETFIDKERVDTDITVTKRKTAVSSVKKRKEVTEEESDEDETTSDEETCEDVSETIVKEIVMSEDLTDDVQSKKSPKKEPSKPSLKSPKQTRPQMDDVITVTKTTVLESRVPVDEVIVTKKFIEALHRDEEMEKYVENTATETTKDTNKIVKKYVIAKPGDKSPTRKKQDDTNKERVDVEVTVTKTKGKIIPRHPSPVKKLPDKSPDRTGIKRTTITKKINVDEFTGETEYTDQYCKTTKVKQITPITMKISPVRKQPTVKKTAVYNVGNVNGSEDTSIVIKTFKIPNGDTPKTAPSRQKPKESPKKKEVKKPSPLIKRPPSPIKKIEDKLKQTKVVESDFQTKRTVSKLVEIKQTKPITRTVQKIETQPKRHVVSTIINIKPKYKPETIASKQTYQTVTTTKTTKISPKITITSKTKSSAKPIQNGHVSDTDSETEIFDEDRPQKITRTTSDRAIKSPRKTPVRGASKPELLTQPAKKCITTKSILIENAVADEREIIVDLKRSKSSREETPDRICPFPVPTNEDSGIPRYPDHITEPEDASRPKPQRVSDVPLTESEDVVEFNRITEVTDKSKTIDRVQDTDECLLSVNEKVSKFLTTAEQLTKPKDAYKRPHDDESFLSVSDKVNKFITTAEHMTTQRPKSPKVVDTNVDEGDESLLSVSEKVSHFISTAEKIHRPSKPKDGVVPKVPRPDLTEVAENIRSDECLLSVSDKVTKFITTADKLTSADYKKTSKVEPKSRSQSPKKDVVTECTTVETDEEMYTRRASPEKSPVRKSATPTRRSHESSPVPTESPNYRTPERRPSDLITKKTDAVKPTRKDSFPLETTPKSSRRTSQDEPKTILSPTGRLRSTETIKKAKALFENINKEQEILKQRDTFTRTSVLGTKKKIETDKYVKTDVDAKIKDVRTKLTYDDTTHKSRETSPSNVPHYATPVEPMSKRHGSRSRDSSPGDVPHYMTPIERHHHQLSTKPEKLTTESAPKSRDSSPDEGDIPHYMTPLERHQHDTIHTTKTDRYVNKTESVSTYTSKPRSRDSTPDGDVPHYMTPLDRQYQQTKTTHGENYTRRSRPRSRDSSPGDGDVPHYMAPLDRSVHHHVPKTDRVRSVEHVDRSATRSRESTPDREIPHYMTPLDRSLRDKSPHVEQFDDGEGKATKFGVTLRRTDSGRVITSSRRKSSTVSVDKQITEIEVEEIYDLEYLEKLLETIVGYDIRRKIRAQIRIIKRMMEENELEITTRKTTKTTSSTKSVPKRSEKTPERSPKTTDYQSNHARKPSADTKLVDHKYHQHAEWAHTTGTSERTTEYQSSYKYNEKSTSTELKSERRSSSVETKPTRAKTPDKREKEKSTSPVRKTSKAEPAKVFQTELKKTKPLAKTVVNDKPDWVTQRTLRKVTETGTPVRKAPVKSTKKESRTSSPGKDVKPTDVITSSYGVGPMDENGTPLFGLKALRAQNKSEKTKIQGTVIRSHYHAENGEEPVGEVSVTKFSTDPKDLGSEELSKGEGITSVTTTQKFGYKGTPSLKTIKGSKKQTEEDVQTTTKTSKVTRRGSVKEISQKFIENAVETLKSERQSSYPKAGLILRTSSFKDTGSSGTGSSREGSPDAHEFRKTVTTTKSSTTTCGDTFLSNKSKVAGVQDVLARMKTEDVEEGESQEDRDARNLLNKFIGSQVILAGMETQVSRPSTGHARQTTTKVTTTTTSEGGQPKTVTRSFTHPITDELLETVWDEETLKLLLEQSTDYEDRRIIRARLRQVMAEQDEKVETTTKTFSEGPVTSQVTTRVTTQQQVTKKPLSPFAKFRQLDKQNSLNSPPSTPKTPTGGGPLFKFTDPALNRSASTVKERLLQWCQMKTKEYENIQLDNFSTSWADGLAFCALVHHFLPDAFDYHALNPKNRRHNFTLAFQVADDKAGIAPLLDVDDMVATRRPDWKCVFTYVQSIYRRFKDED